jgi:hypothetical protein
LNRLSPDQKDAIAAKAQQHRGFVLS